VIQCIAKKYFSDLKVTPLGKDDRNICWPFGSVVRLHRSHSDVKVIEDQAYQDLDNLTIEDLENDTGERLDYMVHVKNGVK
jgi:hypothetical protein